MRWVALPLLLLASPGGSAFHVSARIAGVATACSYRKSNAAGLAGDLNAVCELLKSSGWVLSEEYSVTHTDPSGVNDTDNAELYRSDDHCLVVMHGADHWATEVGVEGSPTDFYGISAGFNNVTASNLQVIWDLILGHDSKYANLSSWAASCPGDLYLSGHGMGGGMASIWAYLANLKSDPLGLGKQVAAVFLFDSQNPATTELTNNRSDDGCFQGMQFYSVADIPGFGQVADPSAVTAAYSMHPTIGVPSSGNYVNAKIAMTSLPLDGPADVASNRRGPDLVTKCGETPEVYERMNANISLIVKAWAEYGVKHQQSATLGHFGLHEPLAMVWGSPWSNPSLAPRIAAAAVACTYRLGNSNARSMLAGDLEGMCELVPPAGWHLEEEYRAVHPGDQDIDSADLWRSGDDCLIAMHGAEADELLGGAQKGNETFLKPILPPISQEHLEQFRRTFRRLLDRQKQLKRLKTLPAKMLQSYTGTSVADKVCDLPDGNGNNASCSSHWTDCNGCTSDCGFCGTPAGFKFVEDGQAAVVVCGEENCPEPLQCSNESLLDTMIEDVFAQADTNSDSQVSASEIAAACDDSNANFVVCDPTMAQAVVDAGDTNQDLELDLPEVKAFIKCHFCQTEAACTARPGFYGQFDLMTGLTEELEVIFGLIRAKHGSLKTWAATCTGDLYLAGHSMGGGMASIWAYLANLLSDPLGMGKTVSGVFLFSPMPASTSNLQNGQSADGCFQGAIYYPRMHFTGFGTLPDPIPVYREAAMTQRMHNIKLPWTSLDMVGPATDQSNLLGPTAHTPCGELPLVYQVINGNETLYKKAMSESIIWFEAEVGLHEPIGLVWPTELVKPPFSPRLAAAASACAYRKSNINGLLAVDVEPLCDVPPAAGWILTQEYTAPHPAGTCNEAACRTGARKLLRELHNKVQSSEDTDNADLYRYGNDCLLAMHGADIVEFEDRHNGTGFHTPTSYYNISAGFHNGLTMELDNLLNVIKQKHGSLAAFASSCPGDLYVTGHSMGGSIAAIFAFLANHDDDPLQMGKTVKSIYLYAPAPVATQALTDGQSDDGCFDGMTYFMRTAPGYHPFLGCGTIADITVEEFDSFVNVRLPWTGLDVKGPTSDPANLLGPDQQYACGVVPQIYKDMAANATQYECAAKEYLTAMDYAPEAWDHRYSEYLKTLGGNTGGLHEPGAYGNSYSTTGSTTLTVRGDPVVKRGDESGTHFWIRSGEMTPLLMWESPKGKQMKLLGMTMDRPNSGNQWFKQLVISVDGLTVLDVSAEMTDSATAKMIIDGGRTYTGGVRSSQYVSHHGDIKVLGSTRKIGNNGIGKKQADELRIDAGGTQLLIWTSKAAKFKNPKTQVKFMHLNFQFDEGVPEGSKGLLAEIAGVAPMSASTSAILKSRVSAPAASERSDSDEDRQEVAAALGRVAGDASTPAISEAAAAAAAATAAAANSLQPVRVDFHRRAPGVGGDDSSLAAVGSELLVGADDDYEVGPDALRR